MNCIAAADRNWGIGKDGKLLASIPGDMKYFRQMTSGKTVIMGRKTLESFPGGQPLKNRVNIVITSNKELEVPGANFVHSVEEALDLVKDTNPEDIFVIGGGSIYREMLPYCDKAYITRIDFSYDADTYFPNLETDPEWELETEGEEQTCFDLIYEFDVWKRIKGKPPRKMRKYLSR